MIQYWIFLVLLLLVEPNTSVTIVEDDRLQKLKEEHAEHCLLLQKKLSVNNSFSDLQINGFISPERVAAAAKKKELKERVNPIQLENCLDGLDSRYWDANAAGDPSIQGFAHPFSNLPGTTVDFRVKTPSNKYRIDVFRLGYYNGKGARKIISIDGLPIEQPEFCYEEADTHLVDCLNWKVSASWNIPAHAVSGVYLARLVREDVVNVPQNKYDRFSGDEITKQDDESTTRTTSKSTNTTTRELLLEEEIFIRNENKNYNFRADASSIAPSLTFANADRDRSLPWPCGSNELCENIKHAYGARRRHQFVNNNLSPLQNNLVEPRASLVYFVVRSNRGEAGEIVVQTLDTTWQAYNNYMAPSTYGVLPLPHHNFEKLIETRNERSHEVFFTKEGGIHTKVTKVDNDDLTGRKPLPLRAYKLSYNRPFITRDVRAVNIVFNAEYPLIRFLESHGFDVTYVTGIDVHLRATDIFERKRSDIQKNNSKLFISVGHDEYWSTQQRWNIEYFARDELGMNLAFLSGNEVYWNHRWERSVFAKKLKEESPHLDEEAKNQLAYLEVSDPSTMVIYKESQESRKIDPDTKMWTGTFRDERRINKQGAWPENSLTGTIFTANAWRNDPLRVPYKYSRHRFWRHTAVAKLKENQTAIFLKGMIGHEFDEDLDNGFRPVGLMRLSETTIHNVQLLIDHGSLFDTGTATHHLVLYRTSKGALVFGAGTVQYVWALDPYHDSPTGLPNMVENCYDTRVNMDQNGSPEKDIVQATINLFVDMGLSKPTGLLQRTMGIVWDDEDKPPMEKDKNETSKKCCDVHIRVHDTKLISVPIDGATEKQTFVVTTVLFSSSIEDDVAPSAMEVQFLRRGLVNHDVSNVFEHRWRPMNFAKEVHVDSNLISFEMTIRIPINERTLKAATGRSLLYLKQKSSGSEKVLDMKLTNSESSIAMERRTYEMDEIHGLITTQQPPSSHHQKENLAEESPLLIPVLDKSMIVNYRLFNDRGWEAKTGTLELLSSDDKQTTDEL